ncbi:MAG: adenine-specific methyltransferase EcoRI family protein [Candidatus Levybacteria bacterium]|nr:adenine-specific methyltransferase EcoRI family protein [Candidatus Levybacteria bacterium]
MARKDLKNAKIQKEDEFYTQLADIESELKHYKSQFRGKVVFCNCDDPKESNFVKYFSMNFEHLGLKKLIATHYKEANLFTHEPPYKLEYTGDKNGNRMPDPSEFMTKMISDGDFRSQECINLLKEADIVVTNPPFSMFREYVAQLIKYNKKFLIIGNTNSLTYKEIFKLIKENKLRTGYTNFNVGMFFIVPNDWEKYHHIDENGKKIVRVSTSCWFTNLDVTKHHEFMTLYKKYTPEEYPKYENYDAINIDIVANMPKDYDGAMGVPITFLDKYNPEQFEIIGLGISNSGIEVGVKPYKAEHKKYRKEVQKRGAVDGDLYMITNGIVDVPYARILVKNKKYEN